MLKFVYFKMDKSRPLFVYFRPFLITITIIYRKSKKAQMVCLGFKPKAAEWQAQTKPRSYVGRTKVNLFTLQNNKTRKIRGRDRENGLFDDDYDIRLMAEGRKRSKKVSAWKCAQTSLCSDRLQCLIHPFLMHLLAQSKFSAVGKQIDTKQVVIGKVDP